MTNILNKKRKKKGFTLIELVIVLAVLAIIALIAIPNFTKVRNDSLDKADQRTAEQIRKIVLMAIADKDIQVKEDNYKVTFHKDGKFNTLSPVGAATVTDLVSVNGMLKEVKKPQKNGKENYLIKVTSNGDVSVGYPKSGDTEFDKEGTLSQ